MGIKGNPHHRAPLPIKDYNPVSRKSLIIKFGLVISWAPLPKKEKQGVQKG